MTTASMAVHYSSEDLTWETPADLFAVLDSEFGFDLDVCAVPATAKCERYFTPEIDGLAQVWRGVCWCNPPYGRQIVKWMRRAYHMAGAGLATVVCLVPARTDTAWWWAYARHGEIRLLPGRLRFGGAKSGAPFPSAVIVFRPGLPDGGRVWHWNWREQPAMRSEFVGRMRAEAASGDAEAERALRILAPDARI